MENVSLVYERSVQESDSHGGEAVLESSGASCKIFTSSAQLERGENTQAVTSQITLAAYPRQREA